MNPPTETQTIRDPRFGAGADFDRSWQLAAAAAGFVFGLALLVRATRNSDV